jgi:hypothetical protein
LCLIGGMVENGVSCLTREQAQDYVTGTALAVKVSSRRVLVDLHIKKEALFLGL